MTPLPLSMFKFYPILLSGLCFPKRAWVYWNINPIARMLSLTLQNTCQNASLGLDFISQYFQLVIGDKKIGENIKDRKRSNI